MKLYLDSAFLFTFDLPISRARDHSHHNKGMQSMLINQWSLINVRIVWGKSNVEKKHKKSVESHRQEKREDSWSNKFTSISYQGILTLFFDREKDNLFSRYLIF